MDAQQHLIQSHSLCSALSVIQATLLIHNVVLVHLGGVLLELLLHQGADLHVDARINIWQSPCAGFIAHWNVSRRIVPWLPAALLLCLVQLLGLFLKEGLLVVLIGLHLASQESLARQCSLLEEIERFSMWNGDSNLFLEILKALGLAGELLGAPRVLCDSGSFCICFIHAVVAARTESRRMLLHLLLSCLNIWHVLLADVDAVHATRSLREGLADVLQAISLRGLRPSQRLVSPTITSTT